MQTPRRICGRHKCRSFRLQPCFYAPAFYLLFRAYFVIPSITTFRMSRHRGAMARERRLVFRSSPEGFAFCELCRRPVIVLNLAVSVVWPPPAIYSISTSTMIHLFKLPCASGEAGCPHKRSASYCSPDLITTLAPFRGSLFWRRKQKTGEGANDVMRSSAARNSFRLDCSGFSFQQLTTAELQLQRFWVEQAFRPEFRFCLEGARL